MNLLILCPGLFRSPDPTAGPAATPAIDRLLARANPVETPPQDPLTTLAAAYGLVGEPGIDADTDLPSAPLCLLAEAPDQAGDGCWFHADPVHLRADRDRLLLFAGAAIAPRPDESAALVAAFNAHFAEDGLHLLATQAHRWYLRVPQCPDLRTRPLHAVNGQDVDAWLPTGPDARTWNRWQNEAQMLFYTHPVNQAREAAGQPVISGVWTWGGGRLPAVTGGPALTIADHPLAIGLARACGGARRGLGALRAPGTLVAGLGSVLVFWDRLWWPAMVQEPGARSDALAELEALVAALLPELAAGRVATLTIGDGARRRFTLTRSGLRAFWRRRGGLRHWSARGGD